MPIDRTIRWLKQLADRILMLHDTPHSIALGTALGVFVAFTPTIGLQMIIVTFITLFIRANRLAGCLMVYISNPVTALPIYWFNYEMGALVVPSNLTKEELARLLEWQGWTRLVENMYELTMTAAVPLWLGSILVGAVFGIATFPITLGLVNRYRRKHLIDKHAG